MRELPIMFTAPMVRAILAGRKTQTRRLRYQPVQVVIDSGDGPEPILVEKRWAKVTPGTRIWVKETFSQHATCAASECMAWRWHDPADQITTLAADRTEDIKAHVADGWVQFGADKARKTVNFRRPLPPLARRGFCGMAGQVRT